MITKNYMDTTLNSVNDDYNGFQELIKLFGSFHTCLFENIDIHYCKKIIFYHIMDIQLLGIIIEQRSNI